MKRLLPFSKADVMALLSPSEFQSLEEIYSQLALKCPSASILQLRNAMNYWARWGFTERRKMFDEKAGKAVTKFVLISQQGPSSSTTKKRKCLSCESIFVPKHRLNFLCPHCGPLISE